MSAQTAINLLTLRQRFTMNFILIFFEKVDHHLTVKKVCEQFLQQIEISRGFLTPVSHGICFQFVVKIAQKAVFLF